MTESIRAPFPYFGGKKRVAAQVWGSLGDVDHYVEPFCGSAAVLLSRPNTGRIETINDADGMVSNFWRSVAYHPDVVQSYLDWPVNEADLCARNRWLIGQRESLTERLMADPEWCDPKAAGWWAWGLSQWIGGGWASRDTRQIPFLGNTGMGVHSLNPTPISVLSARLRRVRVACGDWGRVVSPSVLFYPTGNKGTTGVFLDPPYAAGSVQYAAGGVSRMGW